VAENWIGMMNESSQQWVNPLALKIKGWFRGLSLKEQDGDWYLYGEIKMPTQLWSGHKTEFDYWMERVKDNLPILLPRYEVLVPEHGDKPSAIIGDFVGCVMRPENEYTTPLIMFRLRQENATLSAVERIVRCGYEECNFGAACDKMIGTVHRLKFVYLRYGGGITVRDNKEIDRFGRRLLT
jgi:hypothetical protein